MLDTAQRQQRENVRKAFKKCEVFALRKTLEQGLDTREASARRSKKKTNADEWMKITRLSEELTRWVWKAVGGEACRGAFHRRKQKPIEGQDENLHMATRVQMNWRKWEQIGDKSSRVEWSAS